MKRVIVSVTNDLITDQRVHKTCEVISEIGFEVLLVGRKYKNSDSIQRPYKIKRFQLICKKGVLFYAEYNVRLFLFLLFHKKHILFSNDLDTLLPNYLIHKLQQKNLIFDSHELFSEIPELVNRRSVKKIWLSIEKKIIPKLKHLITVSDSIKDHYKKLYGVSATVVRNIPKNIESPRVSFDFETSGKKIILYQGSVNIGRGIELMIQTMPLLNEYLFIIIGEGDVLDHLKNKVRLLSLDTKVKFLGKKNPEELKKLTSNASIGISLEEDLGLNYRYALPNKIFDYIHANVPIIVSDLPEMKKIINNYPVGEVLTRRTPEHLGNIIKLIGNKKYKKELKIAKRQLNWSLEKEKLISIFSKLD